jgi:hypothetical protein
MWKVAIITQTMGWMGKVYMGRVLSNRQANSWKFNRAPIGLYQWWKIDNYSTIVYSK